MVLNQLKTLVLHVIYRKLAQPSNMLKTQIGSVLKQALTTFTCKTDTFYQNIELLKSLLDKTTAEDVNLPHQFLTDTLWERPNKAPVTYINIYEDNNVTMGIFILKPGMRLPLHNHPHMHGLIKVIGGVVKITSYSLNTDKIHEIDTRSFRGSSPPLTTNTHSHRQSIITVESTGSDLVDTNSECCILEPERKNLHEIESIGGPAAFIDILAPPYETEIPNDGVRKCSYYSILCQITNNVYRLQETCSPSWYWTDSYQYTGPELF